jgi:rhodanese-related sulfurtransferase
MQDLIQFLQQHWTLSLPLAIILILLMVLEFIKQRTSATQISPARLTLLVNHAKATVVDIRSPSQYSEGHIVNAISMPYAELSEKSKKLEKFKANPIIIVCANGLESPKAATTLAKQGLNISILNGGIRAWRDANMPLTKE